MADISRQVGLTASPQTWDVGFQVIAGPETAARLGIPVGTVIEERESTTAVATGPIPGLVYPGTPTSQE